MIGDVAIVEHSVVVGEQVGAKFAFCIPGSFFPFSVALHRRLIASHTHIYIYVCVCVYIYMCIQKRTLAFGALWANLGAFHKSLHLP